MRSRCQSDLIPDFTDHRVLDRFHLLNIIGTGSYGVVYRAVDMDSHRSVPRYVAVKVQLRAQGARPLLFQRRELNLHKLASNHQGVAALHDFVFFKQYIFLIMDFCEDGDLFSMLTKSNPFKDNDAFIKSMFLQLLDAVEYLHSEGVYHRDLKPENILCSDGGRRFRITDFGLASAETTSGDFECGSSYYMSPECIGYYGRFGTYAHRANDIWALGIILVNACCTRNPWKLASLDDISFQSYMRDPRYLREALPISDQTYALLRKIFTLNPARRISIPELRKAIVHIDAFTISDKEHRERRGLSTPTACNTVPPAVRPKPAAVIKIPSKYRADDDDDVCYASSDGSRYRIIDSLVPEPRNADLLASQVDEPTAGSDGPSTSTSQCGAPSQVSALSTAASSDGPATPEVFAVNRGVVVADDDVLEEHLDMGNVWIDDASHAHHAPPRIRVSLFAKGNGEGKLSKAIDGVSGAPSNLLQSALRKIRMPIPTRASHPVPSVIC